LIRGRGAGGGVKALAQPGLLHQRRIELLNGAVVLLACRGHKPVSPSVGAARREKAGLSARAVIE
jgi:hypothetical protein